MIVKNATEEACSRELTTGLCVCFFLQEITKFEPDFSSDEQIITRLVRVRHYTINT